MRPGISAAISARLIASDCFATANPPNALRRLAAALSTSRLKVLF
jgi:hypothetical protein